VRVRGVVRVVRCVEMVVRARRRREGSVERQRFVRGCGSKEWKHV
jgi:hypothetical protein